MENNVVVYDACVLYPAPLRDLLMHLALTGLYQAKWSNRIHEEWIRNVLKNRPDLKRKQLERTRDYMNQSALDCLVTDFDSLIPELTLPDDNDRHVLAAAIQAKASYIITFNLKDFPAETTTKYGIEAQHPDRFLSELFDNYPGKTCAAVKQHRDSLQNPAMDPERYLKNIEKQTLPAFCKRIRRFTSLI